MTCSPFGPFGCAQGTRRLRAFGMGGLIARCIGKVRNAWGIALTNLVCNLARYEQIVRLKLDTWNQPVTAATVGNAAGLA